MDAIQLSFSESSQWLLRIILALLMFGVALDLRPADFARVCLKPRAALVGLLCQFLVLPACTFALILVIAHNTMAFAVANLAGRAARLEPAELRTVTIEVGIQNSGLALGIIFTVFNGLGGMAVVAMLWGIWHIIAGSLLAIIWGYRSSKLAHSVSLDSEAVTS